MSKDGSDEIIAGIDRFVNALEGPAIVEAGQEWVEQEAKPEAQHLVHVLTGATRDSIDGIATPANITMFATTPWAATLEFGGIDRNAYPYLLPAVKGTLAKLGRHLIQALDRRKK